MSQRNFQNARNQGSGPKGKSRKSASSAKLKSKAGSSVYVRSKDAKNKTSKVKAKRNGDQPLETKSSNPEEQMRRRERAMVSMMKDMPEYKKWRRIWWVLMILAFIAVVGTWIPSMLIQNGAIGSDFEETARWISSVGFIFAVVALIGAFYIDFRKIRKLQRAQEAKAHNLTKAERRQLDDAIGRAIEKDNQKRAERKGKMPWNRSKDSAKDGAKEEAKEDSKDEK